MPPQGDTLTQALPTSKTKFTMLRCFVKGKVLLCHFNCSGEVTKDISVAGDEARLGRTRYIVEDLNGYSDD